MVVCVDREKLTLLKEKEKENSKGKGCTAPSQGGVGSTMAWTIQELEFHPDAQSWQEALVSGPGALAGLGMWMECRCL